MLRVLIHSLYVAPTTDTTGKRSVTLYGSVDGPAPLDISALANGTVVTLAPADGETAGETAAPVAPEASEASAPASSVDATAEGSAGVSTETTADDMGAALGGTPSVNFGCRPTS